MCAGMTCVHSSLGALPETSMGQSHMYPYTEDRDTHMKRFQAALEGAIEDVRAGYRPLPDLTAFNNATYSWDYRQLEWMDLLTSLL